MAGPGPIHQAIRLILFVLSEHSQRASVELRIFAAGIQRRHAADGQDAALVTDFRNQLAQILEERHIVGNGVAVRQNPFGIGQIEMNEGGHVVPAAQIQRHQMVAQVVNELLELEGEGMRFHQRHALDGVIFPTLEARQLLEKIAPPQRFFRRFGFGYVKGERML